MPINRVYIESPPEEVLRERYVTVAGWCASERSERSVRVLVNGTECAVNLIDRPDVVALFPDSQAVGFAGTVDLFSSNVVKQNVELTIEVQYAPVGTQKRVCHIAPTLLRAIREGRPDLVGGRVDSSPPGRPILTDAQRRRMFLERFVDVATSGILEIGALDNPTYRPQEANVKYMDWFTTEENYEFIKDAPMRNPGALVDVDYPIKSKLFSNKLDCKFDLVIANHVIEHIPDVIRWLIQLAQVLTSKGKVFLSIPDRNYTFDIVRKETDVIELLRCYDEDLEEPNYYQMLRHVYYWRPVVAKDIWENNIEGKLTHQRYTLPKAMEVTRGLMGTGESTHCSVFSRETFPNLWDELLETGLVELGIDELGDVQPGTNEFHVLLKRRGD